ncbi:MAG TPA: 2-dehydropantoate 2-reductase [Dehalococcoidia bacterium]|nr:2-dehydropantoate 2-reductase [Dehalococcoidia bacterium]
MTGVGSLGAEGRLRVVVLGAGALGSILAAHLGRAGEDVTLIARGPRARLVAESGIRLKGLADFRVRVRIVEDVRALDSCDVFVLTAKTYDTAAALEGVRGLKAAAAFSVQNGVVKDEQLAKVFGAEHTLGCIANYSGEVLEDGTVLFSRNEGLYIGELPEGRSQRVEQIAAMIEAAGVRTFASDRILCVEWSKYVSWLGLTAVAVLSRLYTHQLLQDEDLSRLQVALTREAARIAEALRVPLADLGGLIIPRTATQSSPEAAIESFRRSGAAMEAQGVLQHRMSALQDALRGRRLEVEETFGYAVRKAAELGIPTPALETVYRLLAAIDRHRAAG